MKIYADSSARRTRQLLGDALLVLWIAAWVQVALIVRDATLTLAEPGEQISEADGGLAEQLRAAGTTIGDVPLIGDEVRTPFDGAGDSADKLFIDASEDLDLFALRAMTRQPMHRLARISDDPAGARRRRDPAVIQALAELELADSGLTMPASRD